MVDDGDTIKSQPDFVARMQVKKRAGTHLNLRDLDVYYLPGPDPKHTRIQDPQPSKLQHCHPMELRNELFLRFGGFLSVKGMMPCKM